MEEAKERRRAPRKTTSQPDKKAGAPRRRTSEQREAPAGASNLRADLSPDEIRKLIEEAAYYRAKERNFAPGHELEDWVQAESEVMTRIGVR